MRKYSILLALTGMLLGHPSASVGFADSRAERLKKERRERTENEREWRLKYESDWKNFLSANGRVYRRWTIASKEDRQAFQAHRRSQGLKPLPWRFMHE